MHIGVEEAVGDRLPQEGVDQARRAMVLDVMAGGDERLAIADLDAVDPVERHHAAVGAVPVDPGDEIARRRPAIASASSDAEAASRRRSSSRAVQRLRFAMTRRGRRRAASPPSCSRCGGGPFIGVDIAGEALADAGAQHLDRDHAALGRDGAWWTCAIEAAPTGSLVEARHRELRADGRSVPSISSRIAGKGTGGSASCRRSRSRAASSPTRSGRVASDWPSLIAAGPMAWKASA